MNNFIEDEQRKLHIESENEVLNELQKICVEYSHGRVVDLGKFRPDAVKAKKRSDSSVVEDLLMEMNSKRLKEFDGNLNTDCHRCRHVLNIPQNLLENCDEIAGSTKDYEHNITFVQAIVWLKSAIKHMKDVSMEQYSLLFHKLRPKNREKGKDPESCNARSNFEIERQGIQSIYSSAPFNAGQATTIISDSGSIDTIELFPNVTQEKRNTLSCDLEQQTERCNENSILRNSSLSISDFQSPERCFANSKRNKSTLNDFVMSESSSEQSSCADMFKDSMEIENIDNPVEDEKDNKAVEKIDSAIGDVKEFSFDSTSNDFSLEKLLGAITYSDNNKDDDSSDVTMINDNCSASRRSVDDLENDEHERVLRSNTQAVAEPVHVSDSNFLNKNPSVASNQIDTARFAVKDSAYDTYSLSAEQFHSSDEDFDTFFTQEVDFVKLYDKEKDDNINDTAAFYEILKICTGYATVSQRDGQSQKDEISIESGGYKVAGEINFTPVEIKKEGRKISSELLSFTLDALNVDDVAFQSVKIVLSAFQDGTIAKQYIKTRDWDGTLEAQAVNAVLDFRDVYDTENETDVCTREILQTVTNTLDSCIENTELSKTTILMHQVSIVLTFCDSMPVCIGTINHLTAKLKSQGSVLAAAMNNKNAEIHNIINQLYTTFYALDICLQKYRSVSSDVKEYKFEEEMVPSVMDLWKKELNFEGVLLEESRHMRDQRWSAVLNDFAVIAIDNFPRFAGESRRLSNILTRK